MIESTRKKTIWSIVIFSVATIALAFIAPLLGGSPSSFGPGFVLWGAAPLLVAILIRTFTRDWSDSGFKPYFTRNARWYLISIIAFPIMTLLTIAIGNSASFASFSGFKLLPFLKLFLTAFSGFIIFALFEEIGWRGYLAPKLASLKMNTFLASGIVAIVWTTWHLPYIKELAWVYSSENLLSFIPRFYLAMFAFAILYNEIRILTGSVWPAVLMHCVANSFGHPLTAEFLTIAPGKDYLVSASGIFMILFAGLLGIAINRWRVRKEKLQNRSLITDTAKGLG